ncbi:MAG: ribosome maturation factor RimM [bacterium]|jgi:16S rRNA processing protein RimM
MKDQFEDWLLIGIVGAPVGLKGEVKIHSETDFPERFEPGQRVFLRLKQDSIPQERLIESARWYKGSVIIRFQGDQRIEDIEVYRFAEVLVPASERMELEEGQYYVSDLIGIDVYLDNGQHIGKIDDVLQHSANDVYVVGKILIPAVRSFILEVDMQGKRMVVKDMPGLLPETQDEG